MPYDVEGIKATIPHRFPFQLVDRVISSGVTDEGKVDIVGIKNVTFNEPYFQSIKNEQPFLPNYLLMEIAAQLGCIRKLSDPEFSHMLGLYLGVDKAMFHKPVLPGDSLHVYVVEEGFKSGFGKCSSKIYVGEEIVAEVNFKYALTENNA
ncbi:hypothetical protein BVY04_04350 [bacterium M21]|nr:hypothetical protein BVY04_04240 [bacterium M21]OVE81054.1 hypothetical protein BVY04_04350 [bacterium M21]